MRDDLGRLKESAAKRGQGEQEPIRVFTRHNPKVSGGLGEYREIGMNTTALAVVQLFLAFGPFFDRTPKIAIFTGVHNRSLTRT